MRWRLRPSLAMPPRLREFRRYASLRYLFQYRPDVSKLLLDEAVGQRGISPPPRLFHHLTDEKVERAFLAAAIICNSLRVLIDRLLNGCRNLLGWYGVERLLVDDPARGAATVENRSYNLNCCLFGNAPVGHINYDVDQVIGAERLKVKPAVV